MEAKNKIEHAKIFTKQGFQSFLKGTNSKRKGVGIWRKYIAGVNL